MTKTLFIKILIAILLGFFVDKTAYAQEAAVCTWKDCKTAAASYTEDDGLTLCQPPLDAVGIKGTFYFSGTVTQSWLSTFSANGHEIGSHLANHDSNCMTPPSCFPDCTVATLYQTPYTQADIINFRQNQIEPNLAVIEAATGKPVVSMSYPCGNTDAGRMIASSAYFVGVRGYYDPWDSNLTWTYDINPPTPVEFMNINADTTFTSSLLDKAISQGGWEIITMHDYCSGIDTINSRKSTLWIAPVGEVLKYIKVRNTAVFSNYVRTESAISFNVVQNLNDLHRQKADGTPMTPIIYDNPVTLKVQVLDTDTVTDVQANGIPLNYSVQILNGTKYVLFDSPIKSLQQIIITINDLTLPGDLNGDDEVNAADIKLLLSNYLLIGAPGFIASDLLLDGKINVLDFGVVVANFGS